MTAKGLHEAFAVVAPGLEDIVADELAALGFDPGEREPGGVAFACDDRGLLRANLHLRAATRVIVRVAEFPAKSFAELERRARKVPWAAFVAGPVQLRVTCRKSRLYHSDAVAQRIAESIARAVPGVTTERTKDDDGGDQHQSPVTSHQTFIVRFLHDTCTISADSSGELLHRRGYRQAIAKAPLRETLAAAMLLALGYDGSVPLMDPMCGSGTIAIEAALLARRIAPGSRRGFACERWPSFDAGVAPRERDEAREHVLSRVRAPILASDRDAGAIEAAVANATRAGVRADIDIARCALSHIAPPDARGLLLTNPPYGARVGDRAALRSLYAQLGNLARGKLSGWTIAMLSADRVLEGQAKLAFEETLKLRNGGIPVRLVTARTRIPGRD